MPSRRDHHYLPGCRAAVAAVALWTGSSESRAAVVHPLPSRAPQAVETRDTVLRFTAVDGTPLAGKLSLPAGATARVPLVFYLHGAGPRCFDHPVRYRAADGQIHAIDYYAHHARELAREELAFFRIGKRGCTIDSTGRPAVDRSIFSAATPTVLLADYTRALDALRQHPGIDAERIVLFGSSEGTRLAARLAVESPAGVAGLVLTAYQSDNFRQTVMWQNTIGPWRNIQALVPAATDSGLTRADYEAAVARLPALAQQLPFGLIDRDTSGTMTPAELAQLNRARLDAILGAVEARNDDFLWTNLLNLSSAYLLDDWEGEPTHTWLTRLDVPIGIFHGALDGVTRVEGVRETEAALRSAGKTTLTVRVYPRHDHNLGWSPAAAARGQASALDDAFRYAAGLVRETNPVEHRYATVNGVRLHYAESGQGTLMLFLHGFPEFWYAWRQQLAHFGRDHHAVAPDLRGYNLSEKPAELDAYRLPHLVEDVRALAVHLNGGAPFVLVGHDWGGVVAWAFAMAHPHLLEKLVIVNGPHPVIFRRELANNAAQQQASRYMLTFRSPDAEAILSANGYAALLRIFEGLERRGHWTPADREAYLTAWSQPGALTGGLNYYRASALGPTAGDANGTGRVSVPTLVVWGEQDTALLTGNLEGLDRYVPHLTVKRIPDGTHWVIHEHGDTVNRLIREFLAR